MEKSKKSINLEGGNVGGGWKKIIINKRVSTFIKEMRVALFSKMSDILTSQAKSYEGLKRMQT